MADQTYVERLQDDGSTAESRNLVFDLMEMLKDARFDLESDQEKASRSISKASLHLGLEAASAIDLRRPRPSEGLAGWQIQRLQEYIDGRLDQTISVSELGRLVQLSTSYFSRAFKKAFRETPHNYVLYRRVARAKHLLVASSEPCQQIALICGFSDQAHFCRIFKRLAGTTPATWRRHQPAIVAGA